MSPSHFFDNAFGGSAHGVDKGGLTDRGREMVERMEARGMLVDVAHASAATIDDVLAMAARPVVASHTGLRGACDNTRNLTDDMRAASPTPAASSGSVSGRRPVAATTRPRSPRSIRYAVDVAGIEHVALGSDFDGAVRCRSTRPGWSC